MGTATRGRCCGPGWRKRDGELPLLGDDDRTADRAYARQFLIEDFRSYSRGHDFEYAERFEYSGPAVDLSAGVEAYIDKNAVKI